MSKIKGIASVKDVKITFDILDTEELQNELRALKDVFKASYGPTGRLNLIQNVKGGHVTVSSNSQRILNSITSVSTPVTQLLLQTVKGHLCNFNDGGLFTGLLILELIDMSLHSPLPRHVTVQINEHTMNIILNHLQTLHSCKIKADIGNMQQMLCVIKSVLGTKCATGIKSNEVQHLSILLLRGFLTCIPNIEMANKSILLHHLRIQCCEGPSINESTLLQGVVLETRSCFPENHINWENKDMVIKVALFDSSLAGNVDDKWFDAAKTTLLNNIPNIEENVLMSMKTMVDILVENNVKLLACQKVIHPTLQRYLMKKGLYYIERLSINHTEAVQTLTGATTLSTFQGNIDIKSFGSLQKIEKIVVNKKRFLHLIAHQTSHPISTLILCAPDETSLDELQLVCSSVLTTLKQLVYYPFLVPGGGCFETYLAALLIESSQDDKLFNELGCSKGQYREGLCSVASVFLQLARSIDHEKYHHFVDTELHHHWIKPPHHGAIQLKHCLCNLVTSCEDTEWYMTEELVCKTKINDTLHSTCKLGTDYKSATLDVMSMKLNAIKTAFETANMILRVKHFIKEII